MSYNGSGTFLINSAGQPVVANTVISATVFNALTSDLATGLSTAITKDGQTTITANIPFGSNKITGLGSGTAATDAANLGQVQSTAAKLITVTGTDTITGSMSPALTAYAAGQLFYFVSAGANTGPVTINIDSLGAKAITRDGATALANGDINSGEVVVLVYDGTRFQMINAANSFGNTTINGTLTVTGNTGLQANVSITSALSVGGTFNVTGAAALGSTLAVTGKSDLPTVSTASINAAVALITTGTVTNLTASGASIASANIGNLQFTAASIASINAGVAVITNLTATGASIASANVGTAVITAATVTGASIASANVGTAVITTGTVTNLTSTSASVASINAAVALITTGTVTALTATGASVASANVGTAVVTGLTATGASIASVNAGVAVLAAGTAALPSLTTTGDTNTGIFFPAADTVGFSTGGSERMRLDTSGNLGIGLTPTYKFEVLSSSSDVARFTVLNKAIDGTGNLQVFTSNNQAVDVGGSIALGGKNGSGGAFDPWAFGVIKGAKENSTSSNLAGYLAFATPNSGGTVAERLRIDSSGNVGIGTASPGSLLDVAGTIRSTSATPFINLISGSTDMGGIYAPSTSSINLLARVGKSLIFMTDGTTERMRIDTSGNVGIGTASPGQKLQVSGAIMGVNGYADGLYIQNATSGSYNRLILGQTAAAGAYIYTDAPGGVASTLPLSFWTSGARRMDIDSSGNVGIGTASPAARLDVGAGSGSVSIRINGASSGTANGANIYLSNNGTVVGTLGNPSVVSGGAFDNSIALTGYYGLRFDTTGTERMRITSAGNIVAGASAALATTATDGFLYVPTCAGTPTGTPTAITGMAPIVVNTTNNKLYFYSGGAWRDAGP